MEIKNSVKQILKLALNRAKELNHSTIQSEHIMFGLVVLDVEAKKLLTERGVNVDIIGLLLTDHLSTTIERTVNGIASKTPIMSGDAKNIIGDAEKIAMEMGHEAIQSEHLLLSLLKNNNYIAQLLPTVNQKELNETIKNTILMSNMYNATDEEPTGNKKTTTKPGEKSKTPILDNFSVDLCQAARNGEIDPIVGRAKEIERVGQILSRRRKNNPVLIGEPGCVLPETLIKIRKVSDNPSHNIHKIINN